MNEKLPKRTRGHILETESERYLLSKLPTEWVVNKPDADYGVDLEIEVFSQSDTADEYLAENKKIYVQLKASDSYSGNAILKQRISVSSLNYLCKSPSIAMLFCFSSKENKAFFIQIKEYVDFVLNEINPEWKKQKTVVIYIPTINEIGVDSSVFDYDVFNYKLAEKNALISLAIILRYIKHKGRVDLCLRYLETSNDPDILAEFLKSSGYLNTRTEQLDCLVCDYCKNEDYRIRVSALEAMGKIVPACSREVLQTVYSSIGKWWIELVKRHEDHPYFPGKEDYYGFLRRILSTCSEVGDGEDRFYAWMLLNESIFPESFYTGYYAVDILASYLPNCNSDNFLYIKENVSRYMNEEDMVKDYNDSLSLEENIMALEGDYRNNW